MRRFAAAVALLACCAAQDHAPIRVDVRLVNVAFTARDESGALVKDLTKNDIEVVEDGAPQTISFFAHSSDLPLTLGLIVDASASQQHFIKRHEHDLKEFLNDVLTRRDRAFLVCFGNHIRVASDFSSSSNELIDGLKRFEKNTAGMREIGPPDWRELGTAFYDAIFYSTTEMLASESSGRKSLVVFSDGEDNSSAHHMLDAIEAAQRENVVVFGVRYTERKRGRLSARNKYGIRVMERLSRETGGADFDSEKTDLRKAFRTIGEDLRSSYELAYHSTNPVNDGTFHKLVVRARRPGIMIRTKPGYFAGRE